LRLLTRDDAVVADLVEAGKITADEARLHPLRNVLTSALGRHEDVAVQLVQLNLKTGDRLLLCSDGVHGPIDQSVIAELLDGQTDPASTARRLVQAAKDQGGPDNISCIVVDIGEDSTNLKN
jgi:protein phosphatase